MIIGTAGHIDHGKSALVRALTGTDPDRWEEEKARGITLDLGYAYATGRRTARGSGSWTCPGHERLVHNMLAGATGIDFVLLVIAADDGPMPQTREHLEIVDLLGLGRGAVALTKCDLVDAARCAEVHGPADGPARRARASTAHRSSRCRRSPARDCRHCARTSCAGRGDHACPRRPRALPARHRPCVRTQGDGRRS